jgi:hypothetical protein
MRGHLRDICRYLLCILFNLRQVDLHPGEPAGLNFLHKFLEGLCILLEHDDVASGALNAGIFFDKGQSAFDKVLVGQLDVGVGN